ncbi:MAG: magnesium chelatase subunit H [Alphaproteobacteria bacterium]|nr:magnesium chelatase subunit H [Alphaproteobacteria bacterium]
MTQRAISSAESAPVRVVIVSLDNHLAGVVRRAEAALQREIPGLSLTLHAASDWAEDADALARCRADIARGDVVVATMLFMEDHIQAVLGDLIARRDACDVMVGALSAGEVIRVTRMGDFRMDGADKGPMKMLKRLRGSRARSGSGAGQMAMLRRLPKLLKFIPGAAQDLRAYFLTMQYWLSGSAENLEALVRFLIGRYADGPRRGLRETVTAPPPILYPDVGLYHPRADGLMVADAHAIPRPRDVRGTAGLVLLRSYVLAKDTGHYDGVIAALEARGLAVLPVYAAGLDARPAIERYFFKDGAPCVDVVISLTGFSLVGGPAYSDAHAAEEILARLDTPYIAAQPLEFQTLAAWRASITGLTPIESTMMIAIPELDGAISPMVFGGRGGSAALATSYGSSAAAGERAMEACPERAAALAARAAKLAALRRRTRAERKIALVLFNFPPNAGATGTAAYLDVFASLHNTLKTLAAAGYTVDVPDSAEALRDAILNVGADTGADANVHARVSADDFVRREPHLAEIEAQWGPAPGRQLSDGRAIFVLGAAFGNAFVGIQPPFGTEGDPMRLMFETSFAPTHAFSAFYRYIREDFAADAIVHFGMHGALEFMPGKQTGLSGACWPERLIGDCPHFYLYAANNPSEGALARRRSGATLISYLTPPLARAGLHKGLRDVRDMIDRWRTLAPHADERADLEAHIREQARALDIQDEAITAIQARVAEVERALIPAGLHVIGAPPDAQARADMLEAIADARGAAPPRAAIEALVSGASPAAALSHNGVKTSREALEAMRALARADQALKRDHELPALIAALDGGYIRPAPGGDIARNPEVLPTGRNIHGFDPTRLPSAFALRAGQAQARRLLDRHHSAGNPTPESIAMVLWGSDNLKNEGRPIAQALALMGAAPRFDSYDRLCGAQLIPLAALGRPRIDVVMTLSGIFRDLLAPQVRMLAEAAYLAATADEAPEANFVRKHALDLCASEGCDMETAALRVFSNAEGAYGANVNQMIDAGCWSQEDDLADAFMARKSFAYGRKGAAVRQTKVLESILKRVDFTYQSLESAELGVTSIDHYVDALGGISRAVARVRGMKSAVYIGDETGGGDGAVRTLAEQLALETHARTLNPRWFESLLAHGAEGVRHIESQVTNTFGWSATTQDVAPWIYQRISETYVIDPEMRRRLAALNPKASARLANRLLEAHERAYWNPDQETLDALHSATAELEDRMEGITA